MSEARGYATILYEVSEGVATITLNRPDVLNAINQQMGEELHDALRKAQADANVRAIVLTGAGRAFSAGEDIQALRSDYEKGIDPQLGERLKTKYNPIIKRIRQIEKPVIAAVNGVAAGAGAGIAYACDLRIASEKASFIHAFIRVGLAPDSGTSYFLPRLVGLGKAVELAFSGDQLDAAEAQRIGLVNKVVPYDELQPAVKELAGRLAKGPAKALALTKRALGRAYMGDLEEVIEYEAYLQTIAGRSADHKEAVKAFFEKRAPNFAGN